jgi:hypothetical protein
MVMPATIQYRMSPISSLFRNINKTKKSENTRLQCCLLYSIGLKLGWCLTLRVENGQREFEKRVLRRIFGLKRDEETGGWRKLHNEELCNLYCLQSMIRIIKLRRIR